MSPLCHLPTKSPTNANHYFTDPPFGLHQDRRNELPFEGVFSLYKGKLKLISRDLTGPNGIAFSSDEKYLYPGDWDEKKKVVMRCEAKLDGTLVNGKIFFDMTNAPGEDAIATMISDFKSTSRWSV